MPLRYMVPTMASAPRSSSKLTNSKLPARKKKTQTNQHLSTECACGDSMSVLLLLSQLLLLASCCGTDGGASVFPQQLDERRDDGGDATCSGRQLQRSLRVVLHPVLQGALHVGFGIQQQLQRRREATQEKKKNNKKKRLLRLFFSVCFTKSNKANQFRRAGKREILEKKEC